MRFVLFCLASAFAGTVVGHPVPTGTAVAPGITWQWGELPVSTVVYDHCGSTETGDIDATLDPIDHDTLPLTAGYLCGLRINLSDPYVVYGTGNSGGTVSLTLNVQQIDMVIDPPIFVPSNLSSGGTGIRLADTGWISAAMIDLDPNEDIVIGPGHALHAELRDAVRYDSETW
jgi:hypothetical protein